MTDISILWDSLCVHITQHNKHIYTYKSDTRARRAAPFVATVSCRARARKDTHTRRDA